MVQHKWGLASLQGAVGELDPRASQEATRWEVEAALVVLLNSLMVLCTPEAHSKDTVSGYCNALCEWVCLYPLV